MLRFDHLTPAEQAPWRQLAQDLLSQAPAPILQDVTTDCSLRWSACRRYMVRGNVIAALYYGEGDRWWGDIVVETPQGIHQLGTLATEPVASKTEALECIRPLIAGMPIIHMPDKNELWMRHIGIDPDCHTFFRVKVRHVFVEVLAPNWLIEAARDVKVTLAERETMKNVVRAWCGKVDARVRYADASTCDPHELAAIAALGAEGYLNID